MPDQQRFYTGLLGPPRPRGGAEAQVSQLADWASDYHQQLNTLLINALSGLAQAEQKISDLQGEVDTLQKRMNDVASLDTLDQDISSPPTEQEVQAVQDRVNAIITAAKAG